MTDQTTAPAGVDLGKLDQAPTPPAPTPPVQPAPPAAPAPTQVGTLRQVSITGPGGTVDARWGIVTDSRVYSYDEQQADAAGAPVTVTRTGVQDTVELLSGHSVIVER